MVVILGKDAVRFVTDYVKINPAGIDIAPKKVFRIPEEKIEYAIIYGKTRGWVVNNKIHNITDVLEEIKPKNDFWVLNKGLYYVVFPKVRIPRNMIALAFPRSTFNRLGSIKSPTALFDPGYEGEFNQTWWFPIKFKINVREAWIQLVFIKLESESTEGYQGFWHGEKYE